jgi:transcriptional regulator with XRE-family HTH domain
MTATKSTLADTLSRLRAKSGLSVRQLEDASGVARSVISRLEHGEYLRPSPSTLTRLATALDVEASELLTVAGYTASQAEALPTIGTYLRTKYGHLSADSRQQLAEFLDRLEADQKVKRARSRKAKQ